MPKMPESTAETNPKLAKQLKKRKAKRDPREALLQGVKVQDALAKLLYNAKRLELSGVIREDGTSYPTVDVAAIKAANDVYLKLLDKLVPSLKAVEHSVDEEAKSAGWQLLILPAGAQTPPQEPQEAAGDEIDVERTYPWE